MPRSQTARKVLMIGPALCQRGGIATVEATYVETWKRSEYDLRLVATYTSHYNSKARKLAIALWALVCAAWQLLFWRPDVMHVHFSGGGSFYRKSLFILLTRLSFARPAVVLHCHAADFDSFYENARAPAQAFIRWTLARSDKVLVLSSSSRRLFQGILPGHSIEILWNPVECPVIEATSRERIVLMLGELGIRKGTYDVLKAIPEILARCPDLEFWFGGDGDVAQVKAIVEVKPWRDQVRVLGWVNSWDKKQLLKKVLMLLLPSYHEGLPLAMLEAMASGVPIVSTPVGGTADLITDGQEGLLLTPGAVSEIVSAVTMLAQDDAFRSALAERARRCVLENCEANSVVARLFALYDSLLLERDKASQKALLARQ